MDGLYRRDASARSTMGFALHNTQKRECTRQRRSSAVDVYLTEPDVRALSLDGHHWTPEPFLKKRPLRSG